MSDLDNLKFEIQDDTLGGTRIKVVGVGGGGCNAVSRMVSAGVAGVEFFAMNTDTQALRTCAVPNKVPIGARITHGLGAGSDPEIGRQSALEDTDRIIELLEGADMVFVAAGLGGGTGTGAAPVVAALAKELGALTVAVVTRPFKFEGPRRLSQAQKGLAEIAATVDTVISIPNDRLVDLVPKGTSFFEAFRMADDVLRQGVQGISDIITTPGLINRDFSDVRAIMTGMGYAMMGTAAAEGEGAALKAAQTAIECPLLEEGGIAGARAILLNITASGSLTLHEMHEACELIRAAAGQEDVHVNFGLVADDRMGDKVKITVIAAGFQRESLPEIDRAAAAIAQLRKGAPYPTPPVQKAPQMVPSRVITPTPVVEPEPEPAVHVVAAVPEPLPPAEPEVAEPLPMFELSSQPPPPPAPAKPAPSPAPGEPVLDFDDLDTPAFLRRERKLFQ